MRTRKKDYSVCALMAGTLLAVMLTRGHCVMAAASPSSVAPTEAFAAADPLFKEPYIDVDEWRNAPVRHRYVHGGFKGTDTRFSFYFPPKDQYLGHFFQYITPVPDSEKLSQGARGEEDRIGFAIVSGA